MIYIYIANLLIRGVSGGPYREVTICTGGREDRFHCIAISICNLKSANMGMDDLVYVLLHAAGVTAASGSLYRC